MVQRSSSYTTDEDKEFQRYTVNPDRRKEASSTMNSGEAQGSTSNRAKALKVQVDPSSSVTGENASHQMSPNVRNTEHDDSSTDACPAETDSQTDVALPRPGSFCSSSSDDSGTMAVEIPSQKNTEVVLTQSRSGVRKLKVKFKPEQRFVQPARGGINALRRRRTNRERNQSANIPETALIEELPYPMQVTSPRNKTPDQKGKSTPTPVQVEQCENFLRSDSAFVSLSYERDHPRFTPHPPMDSVRRANVSGSLAISIGQEVTNRIALFEQRHHELSCLHERVQNELQEMTERNTMYEKRITELEKENMYLQEKEKENESLKLSLEQATKENIKLQGFFHEQFNLRNKFEEMVIELQASNQSEVKNLRDVIKNKEDEINNKEDALEKAKKRIAEYEKKRKLQDDKNYNDNLEMITKIERLQEDVRKITAETDRYHDESKKEKSEIQNLKKKLATVSKELDHQMQRYSHLKRDFDEKQRQLENLKRRRGSFGNVSIHSTYSAPDPGSDPLKINKLCAVNQRQFNSSLPAHIPDIPETSPVALVKIIKPRPAKYSMAEANKQQPSYKEKSNPDALPSVNKGCTKKMSDLQSSIPSDHN